MHAPDLATTRLHALDTIALDDTECVEDWVFGHRLLDAEHIVTGSPPLPSGAQERWSLLRDLARDGLVDFVPGDQVEFDIRSALVSLESPEAFHRSARKWSARALLTDDGATFWERERAVDWTQFHSWDFADEDVDGRCVVTVVSGSEGRRQERMSEWLSAPGLVVEAPRTATVKPWPAIYWKMLGVGYAFEFTMPLTAWIDAGFQGDLYERLRSWRPDSPPTSRAP